MADITAGMVKDLRETTGAGMMDCKKALEETGGDIPAAVDLLRVKGLAKAAKKADRVASEGVVFRKQSEMGSRETGSRRVHSAGCATGSARHSQELTARTGSH